MQHWRKWRFCKYWKVKFSTTFFFKSINNFIFLTHYWEYLLFLHWYHTGIPLELLIPLSLGTALHPPYNCRQYDHIPDKRCPSVEQQVSAVNALVGYYQSLKLESEWSLFIFIFFKLARFPFWEPLIFNNQEIQKCDLQNILSNYCSSPGLIGIINWWITLRPGQRFN